MKSLEQKIESREKHKETIYPNIPETFHESFPEGYRPWIDGWSFSVEKLKEKNENGTYKLLTLDLSISDDEYVERVNNGPIDTISERAEKDMLKKFQYEVV